VLIRAETGTADSITVAITGQHEKSPLLDADDKYARFTYRQLTETLIRIDCIGEIRQGLAESWENNEQGTVWTFRLRGNARFSDGERVFAQRIVANWQDVLDQHSAIDSIVAADHQTIRVFFSKALPAVPTMFASPLFAAATLANSQRWVTTGPYRPGYKDFSSLTGRLEPNPLSENRGPFIEIIDARAKDERDLFSEQIDLFITSDPDVIDYAETLDDYTSIALPWETTYVLLSTTRVTESDKIETDDPLPVGLTRGLATEAVRTSSRGSVSPQWWNSLQGCPSAEDRIPRRARAFFYTSGFREILYDENDDIAGNLAERIVAIASENKDQNPETAALLERIPGFQNDNVGLTTKASSPGILAQSLSGGDDFAYIVPVKVHPFDVCSAWSELMERIPWVTNGPNNVAAAVVPLLDVRPHVIVRRADFGLIVDRFGYLTITSPESGR